MIRKYGMHLRVGVVLATILLSGLFLEGNSVIAAENQCEEIKQDIKTFSSRPNTLVVDVRSKSEFVSGHFPGAMRVTANELLNKSLFKRYHVLIIGQPYRKVQDQNLCRQMIKRGFGRVSLGTDVFASWASSRGKNKILHALYELKIPEALAYLNGEQTLVLSSEKSLVLQSHFKNTRYVGDLTDVTLVEILDEEKSLDILVVASGFEFSKKMIQYNLEQNNKIYILEGGVEAVKEFDRKQKAMMEKKSFRLQEVQGCSNK